MRAQLAALVLVLAAGCGDNSPDSGPFSDIAPDRTIRGDDLDGQVDMVRDEFGVPHIHATTMADLAYGQGYVMAADRLPQMDLFRHFASGTVAELFGALDQDQIDTDLEMRMHRFRPVAEETWAQLSASTEPADVEIVVFLSRFADGVNQYLAELRAGEHTLDPAVGTWFDAGRAADWSPVDSLVIGRLQAFSLSYGDWELDHSRDWQLASDRFDGASPTTDPALAARAGAGRDLMPLRAMDTTSTIDSFPESSGRTAPSSARRPRVDPAVLGAAADAVRPKGALARRLRDPLNGSNNWIVGPDHAGGKTLMANDPHLSLSSPSIFYLTHLTVPDRVDVQGITFPGIPGVILGHNQHLAWGATTANHDVTDFYLEEIAPCSSGGGDCVTWNGDEVALESWTETIKVGALGTITDEFTVTYERVPHHGPIVPTIVDHELAPRSGSQAISVRYTGHQVTNELRAFYKLWTASTVTEGLAAMEDFGFGAQNWVMADDQGNIGWTTHALLPKRSDDCFGFHPTENPEGTAPWLVLPGDGSCEWEGFFSADYVPHAVNPAKGFLVTANADPIGAHADGIPLDQPRAEGHLLYVGSPGDYAEGWRAGRITRRIQALVDAGDPITADDMTSVQADSYSNYGSAMTPHLLAAIDDLLEELASPGTHADLESYAAGLPAADRAFASTAKDLLEAWTFETPPAIGATDQAVITDSAATSLFNAWAVFFIEETLDDEARVIGRSAGTWLAATAYGFYAWPNDLATGLATETGEPLLCDDLSTDGEIESCRRMAIAALVRARSWLEGPGFGSADPADWRWGDKHRLTLEALIPAEELNVPPADEAEPTLRGGYPRHGDQYSVDASSPGLGDLDFSYSHGPAMRHVTELDGSRPRTLIALPGGQLYDRDSGHFRDLMDAYWSVNAYFELPFTTEQIVGAAESRWRFR